MSTVCALCLLLLNIMVYLTPLQLFLALKGNTLSHKYPMQKSNMIIQSLAPISTKFKEPRPNRKDQIMMYFFNENRERKWNGREETEETIISWRQKPTTISMKSLFDFKRRE